MATAYVAAALVAGVLAQEVWAQEVWAEDTTADEALTEDPVAIVRRLYADWREGRYPPGGPDVWTPEMQALWRQWGEWQARDGAGADPVAVLMIGADHGARTGVKAKTLIKTCCEADIVVSVGRGTQGPHRLHYGFLRHDDGDWQIAEVKMAGEDGWRLSVVIQAALN